MKITLLGNCQTKALSWYIAQLGQNVDVKWISIEPFLKNWGPNPDFFGKSINVITDTQEGIKRLQSSDYVIFQHIQINTSDNYNTDQLKKHVTRGKLISISSMYYNPTDPAQIYLKGMIERAEKFNVDIPAHKIIEKHGSKIKMLEINHPSAFYFMELVREICKKTGLNYYSNKQYNQLLKEAYPFG